MTIKFIGLTEIMNKKTKKISSFLNHEIVFEIEKQLDLEKVLKHKINTKTFVEFKENKDGCLVTKTIEAINDDFMQDITRWGIILELSNMYEFI